ncbi:MAG: hypothetical protein FWC26_10325 [Fibromonadales bacterium]|nr:hypothetical protein [Fibromonadales bacterium]
MNLLNNNGKLIAIGTEVANALNLDRHNTILHHGRDAGRFRNDEYNNIMRKYEAAKDNEIEKKYNIARYRDEITDGATPEEIWGFAVERCDEFRQRQKYRKVSLK